MLHAERCSKRIEGGMQADNVISAEALQACDIAGSKS